MYIFVMQRHGTIDVLVNDAGVASWTGQGPTDGVQQILHIRSACSPVQKPAIIVQPGPSGLV